MIKKDRMEIIHSLESLKLILERIKTEEDLTPADIEDCNIIKEKIDEVIEYINENTKIESHIMVKITKLKNITHSLEKQL